LNHQTQIELQRPTFQGRKFLENAEAPLAPPAAAAFQLIRNALRSSSRLAPPGGFESSSRRCRSLGRPGAGRWLHARVIRPELANTPGAACPPLRPGQSAGGVSSLRSIQRPAACGQTFEWGRGGQGQAKP
jgi:hypothetical protein